MGEGTGGQGVVERGGQRRALRPGASRGSNCMPSGCSLLGLCGSDFVPWFQQPLQKAVEPETVTGLLLWSVTMGNPQSGYPHSLGSGVMAGCWGAGCLPEFPGRGFGGGGRGRLV